MGIRDWTNQVKLNVLALFYALGHKQTPWYAYAWILFVVGYALSPVDLIPDFLPVIGLLDDLILLPLGVALAVRLVPETVLDDCRARAAELDEIRSPLRWLGLACVVLIWLAVVAVAAWLVATG
jgi:uncharacterized membrane protein YkvA (DUF1232 family)